MRTNRESPARCKKRRLKLFSSEPAHWSLVCKHTVAKSLSKSLSASGDRKRTRSCGRSWAWASLEPYGGTADASGTQTSNSHFAGSRYFVVLYAHCGLRMYIMKIERSIFVRYHRHGKCCVSGDNRLQVVGRCYFGVQRIRLEMESRASSLLLPDRGSSACK